MGGSTAPPDGVVLGPSQEWGTESDIEDLADFAWLSFDGAYGIGTTPAAGDFNADGLKDAVVAGGGDKAKHDDDHHLWLFFGRERGEEPEWDHNFETAVRVFGPDMAGDSLLGHKMAVGDLDGDGSDDLLAVESEDDIAYILAGAELEGADDDVRVDELAFQTWTGGFGCLAVIGDWNDDGYADWVSGHYHYEVDGLNLGAYYFLAGGPVTLQADVADSPDFIHGTSEDQRAGYYCSSADLDGDGVRELLTSGEASFDGDLSSYGVIHRDGGFPEGSQVYSPDLEYVDEREDFGSIEEPRVLDWDGDGDDDLMPLGYDPDHDGLLGFTIIPGWDIPWDHPQYW